MFLRLSMWVFVDAIGRTSEDGCSSCSSDPTPVDMRIASSFILPPTPSPKLSILSSIDLGLVSSIRDSLLTVGKLKNTAINVVSSCFNLIYGYDDHGNAYAAEG